MDLKSFLIERFANFMLGADVWGHAQAAVKIVESPTMTGEQKRANALELLSDVAKDFAKWLLNLAIELAVAKLKARV
jgi:bifunctional DNase/RNase